MLSRVRLFATNGLYSPWDSLGQNTGLGSLSLLQGIFPTQRSNPGLPHCRQILYQLSHKGSQFCKAIILQLKIVINLNFKRKERNYKTNKHCLKQLSDFLFTFYFHALEKEMATHSSILAWRIPGTGEPGGLPSIGLHRVRHD